MLLEASKRRLKFPWIVMLSSPGQADMQLEDSARLTPGPLA